MRSAEQRHGVREESKRLRVYSHALKLKMRAQLRESHRISLLIQQRVHRGRVRDRGEPVHMFVAFPEPSDRRA